MDLFGASLTELLCACSIQDFQNHSSAINVYLLAIRVFYCWIVSLYPYALHKLCCSLISTSISMNNLQILPVRQLLPTPPYEPISQREHIIFTILQTDLSQARLCDTLYGKYSAVHSDRKQIVLHRPLRIIPRHLNGSAKLQLDAQRNKSVGSSNQQQTAMI